MKKLVLYGAFDRYNYGDNIMPILFEQFIHKYEPELLNEFEIEYAAISESNLHRYACYPSRSINSLTETLPDGSVVVVIGGEVLCARNQGLFSHMQKNRLETFFIKVFRKLTPKLFSKFANWKYSSLWEFPFIPQEKSFRNNIRVIYNTVGGDFKDLNDDELNDVKLRLSSSPYISVRDTRTFKAVSDQIPNVSLSPDSAFIMSDLADDTFLNKNISTKITSSLPVDYVVFQAAPAKLGASFEELVLSLRSLFRKTKSTIVLLPIGYASGHDDYYLLRKLNKALPEETILLHELNVWEIMFVIKNAGMFLGTSLHGVITAMSFGVPHFGINDKIAKLQCFLSDWSLAPFNKSYHVTEIPKLPSLIGEQSRSALASKAKENIEKIKVNNIAMLESVSDSGKGKQ